MRAIAKTNIGVIRGLHKRKAALQSLSLMAVLSAVLLFAQAVEYGHSHDSDLKAQFDCEVCLKLGSLDDVVADKVAGLNRQSAAQSYSTRIENHNYLITIRAVARAPPVYI